MEHPAKLAPPEGEVHLSRYHRGRNAAAGLTKQLEAGHCVVNVAHLQGDDLRVLAESLLLHPVATLKIVCLAVRNDSSAQKYKQSGPQGAAPALRNLPVLKQFCLVLAKKLRSSISLHDLELGFHPGRRQLASISKGIGASLGLERLSLSNSRIGDAGLKHLVEGLKENTSLRVLSLRGCSLTDVGGMGIAEVIKAQSCRQSLVEWQASLRSTDCKRRKSQAIPANLAGLTAIDLSCNQLTNITADAICNVLRLGASLQALDFSSNKLPRKSAALLLHCMQAKMSPLQAVDLRHNVDDSVGVLFQGQHLTAFPTPLAPFWEESPPLTNPPGEPKAPPQKKAPSEESAPPRKAPQGKDPPPNKTPPKRPASAPPRSQPKRKRERPVRQLVSADSRKLGITSPLKVKKARVQRSAASLKFCAGRGGETAPLGGQGGWVSPEKGWPKSPLLKGLEMKTQDGIAEVLVLSPLPSEAYESGQGEGGGHPHSPKQSSDEGVKDSAKSKERKAKGKRASQERQRARDKENRREQEKEKRAMIAHVRQLLLTLEEKLENLVHPFGPASVVAEVAAQLKDMCALDR